MGNFSIVTKPQNGEKNTDEISVLSSYDTSPYSWHIFNLVFKFDLNVVFQGKKGESGLPGVDGLPGPPVRKLSFC